jgi:phage terminase large subunit-like protein
VTGAERYARWILEPGNEGKSGRLIKLAVVRFLRDLQRTDLEWDELEAERAGHFLGFNYHFEDVWAGTPIAPEDWQLFIIQQAWAWKYKSTGRRRIRKVYAQIARKNAKSTTVGAGAINYELIASNTNSPQVFVGANNEQQAKICTNIAGRIMAGSPKLRPYFNSGHLKFYSYNEKIHTISFKKKNGSVNTMSKNANTKDGFNPSLGVIDEYHEAKDDKLLNVIESGQGARQEPMLFVITTAGFNKSGPCYSKLRDVSIKILEGVLEDDSMLAFIYELDPEDDWKEEKNWIKANPNLGVSVSLEFLRSRFVQAINEGGSKEIDFRTKNLNEWCDAEKVWIPDTVWMDNHHVNIKTKEPEILISDLKGAVCYGGLDCAKSVDLNAFVLIFPEFTEINGKLITPLIPFFWVPDSKIQQNNDRVDYKKWEKQGFIIKTEGNIADYNKIEYDILKAIDQYDFRGLDYDHAYAGNVASNLANQGIECAPLRQGHLSLTGPTNELERMATGLLFEHFNNPVMRWMIGNVALKTDAAGNIKPDKEKSQNKIDGVAAMVNSIARWKRIEGEQKESTIIWI